MSTKVPAPSFAKRKPKLSEDAIKVPTKDFFKFNPDYDLECKDAADVQAALSSFYKEPVVIEGTNRPIERCALLVKQGLATGLLYTFRGSDGSLYAIPIPMSVIYKLAD